MSSIQAQKNLFPDTFPNSKGYSKVLVKRDCITCNPEKRDEHTGTFVFDKKGNNIEYFHVDNGQKSGMQKYFWNPNGTLKSYQNYNTFSVIDDPKDPGNWQHVWEENEFNEVRYAYSDSNLTKILCVEDNKLDLEVRFIYNGNGQKTEEIIIDYPYEGVVIGFKPNSDEMVDLPDANNTVIKKKNYKYDSDTTYVTYWKKGKKSGSGKMVVNENKKLVFEETRNNKGKIVYRITNEYDQNGKLLIQNILDTGYDGFGTGYDFAAPEKIEFEYDPSGKLVSEKKYRRGSLYLIERYEYVK